MHGRPVGEQELELIRRLRCEDGRSIQDIIEAVFAQFGYFRTDASIRNILGSRRWKLPPEKARELAETRLANIRRAKQRRDTSSDR